MDDALTRSLTFGKGARRSADFARLMAGEVTQSELAQLFETSVTSIRRKLVSLRPVRTDGTTDIYRFRDAASLVAKPPDNLVTRVMRLNHTDLPPSLRKEYWQGEAMRLKVMETTGQLYNVDAVIEYVSALMRIFRMSILLMSDTIERHTIFTDRQRDALREIADGVLDNVREEAQRHFGSREDDASGRPGAEIVRAVSIEEQARDL